MRKKRKKGNIPGVCDYDYVLLQGEKREAGREVAIQTEKRGKEEKKEGKRWAKREEGRRRRYGKGRRRGLRARSIMK